MPLPRAKVVRSSRPSPPKATEWVQLEQRIDALAGSWCVGEVLNLPGWKTLKYKELEDDVLVLAELTTDYNGGCVCPASESELKKSGYTDPYYVLDLPIRCKRARVYYRLQRIYCPRCRTTAHQARPGVDVKHKMTSRLVDYVERESFDLFRSFIGVADEVGCSEQTVRNVFTRRAKQFEDEALAQRKAGLYEPPEWIAIDEVYPQNKSGKYWVITAPAFHKVLDILPANGEKELLKWLLRLGPQRDRVKVVSTDMCPELRRLVRRLLPGARIVVDRYHVHNLLNVAIKEVLDVIRASMTYKERREQMRPEHLLLASYRKLTKEDEKEREMEKKDAVGEKPPSSKQVLDKWLADVPDLARAHRLKEDFSDILQLRDRDKAEELTTAWLQRAHDFVKDFRARYQKAHPGEWPDPFGNIPDTITDWRNSILNYIDCKSMFGSKTVSNSFAEHTNGRIKEAYRVGHHYSYEVLRLKCVYGGVMVRRRPPHPLDAPRLRVVPRPRAGPRKGKKVNPNANLEILRRARIEADDTKGLLPRPEDYPGWAGRFNVREMERVRRAAADYELAADPEPAAEEAAEEATEEAVAEPAATVNREEEEPPPGEPQGRRRRGKYNPDQGALF